MLIPFARGVKGRPIAGQALQFSTSDRAVRAGERVAATKLGALVLEAISGDEYATPNVVARLGEVPDEAVDALAG